MIEQAGRPNTPPPGRFVMRKNEFHLPWARFRAKRPGGFLIFGQTLWHIHLVLIDLPPLRRIYFRNKAL